MKLDNLNYPYTLSEGDIWTLIQDNMGIINMNFNKFNTQTFKSNGFEDNNNVEFLSRVFEEIHAHCIGMEASDFKEAWNLFITLPMQRVADRLKREAAAEDKFGFVSLDAYSPEADENDGESKFSEELLRTLSNDNPPVSYDSEYNVGLSRVSHLPYMEDEFADAMFNVAYNEFCLNTPNPPLMSADEFKSSVARMFMKNARSARDMAGNSAEAEKLMRKIRNRGRKMGRDAVTELLREAVEALPSPLNYG